MLVKYMRPEYVNLPDTIGIEANGIHMMNIMTGDDDTNLIAKYEKEIQDKDVDIRIYDDYDSFVIIAHIDDEEIYNQCGDEDDILDVLGDACSALEKEFKRETSSTTQKIDVNLNINNLDELRKKLKALLDSIEE